MMMRSKGYADQSTERCFVELKAKMMAEMPACDGCNHLVPDVERFVSSGEYRATLEISLNCSQRDRGCPKRRMVVREMLPHDGMQDEFAAYEKNYLPPVTPPKPARVPDRPETGTDAW